MDEIQLFELIQKCKHLRFKHVGIFAADNFPNLIPNNTFIIVNASNSDSVGTHWLLIANALLLVYYFADPLGYPFNYYKIIHEHMLERNVVFEILKDFPIQPWASTLCRLYCVYVAHILFLHDLKYFPIITDEQLLQFVKHMM